MGHGLRGLTWVNVWIKMIIIVVLKLDSRVVRGKARVMSREGQTGLTYKLFLKRESK
jgi:hypothetical protein